GRVRGHECLREDRRGLADGASPRLARGRCRAFGPGRGRAALMGARDGRRAGYRPPAWLRGAHLQTIWPATFAPKPPVRYARERWETPDGDFIEVDLLED